MYQESNSSRLHLLVKKHTQKKTTTYFTHKIRTPEKLQEACLNFLNVLFSFSQVESPSDLVRSL